MRDPKLSIVLTVAIALAGCVRSLHPLYTDRDLIFDPDLVGCWSEEGAAEAWEFSKEDADSYRLVLTDGRGKSGTFCAHLLRIDGKTFLDLFPADRESDQSDFYNFHLLPVHTFLYVKQLKPTLQMSFPDPDWLEKLLKEDPNAIRHEVVQSQVILTASTEELQEFWLKRLDTEGAFGKSTNLKRWTPPEPGEQGGAAPSQETQLQDKSLAYWIARTKSASPAVRGNAAWHIGYTAPMNKEDAAAAISTLVPLLKDEDARGRRWSAWALGRIGAAAKETVPELIELLADEDARVRHASCWALGMIGEAAKPAVPHLTRLIDDRVSFVRSYAVWSLGEIGPPAAESAGRLAELLADRDPGVRASAAIAIGKMGRAAKVAIPALTESLQDEHASVRQRCAEALGEMDPDANAAIPALRRLLHDDSAPARSAAAAALDRIESESK